MNNLSKINVDDIKPGYTLGHADAAILRDELRELLAFREAAANSAAVIYRNGREASVCMIGADLPNGYSDVYIAPPLPVVPDIPKYERSNDFTDYHAGWNACRAYALNTASFRQLDNSSTKHFRENSETSTNSPVIPDGWIAAINRLLDSDGSRGCFSAIRCYDAHQEIEAMLAAAPKPGGNNG